jgi:hypothetical protein
MAYPLVYPLAKSSDHCGFRCGLVRVRSSFGGIGSIRYDALSGQSSLDIHYDRRRVRLALIAVAACLSRAFIADLSPSRRRASSAEGPARRGAEKWIPRTTIGKRAGREALLSASLSMLAVIAGKKEEESD